ncbi:MAG: hypothetical protein WBQ07_18360 [Candidatus Acidiferrales bacterium]
MKRGARHHPANYRHPDPNRELCALLAPQSLRVVPSVPDVVTTRSLAQSNRKRLTSME